MWMRAFGHLAIVAVLALGASAASAAERSLINACWTPDTLAGKPGENIAHKKEHSFDAPMKDGWLVDVPDKAATPYGAVRSVKLPPGKKLIALTFDLCEQPGEIAGYDGAIIDYLRREGIKATFFAGGKWMRSHEERAQQLMADPLFEIGNHSEAHRNLRLLIGDRLHDEVVGPQRAYEAIRTRLADKQCAASHPQAMQTIAPRLSLFRFPYGACNPAALHEVQDQGLTAIQWNLATGDPDPRETSAGIIRAMLTAKPGAIIVNHANGRGWNTAAAMPLAIAALRKKGFEFVTVSELIAAGEPVISPECYDNHPGDTNRYDNLVRGVHPLVLKTQTPVQ
jgi:peptidoglycan-N-acetylglucosamine deacetylase